MSDVVTYESRDGIAIIILNRPDKLNAIDATVVAALRDAFFRFNASDDRCAILTGAGERAFSAGADLRNPPRDPELWECVPGVGVDVDKPIIAALFGHVVGGACVLVQFCDLAVASETTVLHYPESQIGFCGGLIASMAGRIPHKIAMEMMLLGRRFDAQRAYEVGLVNKVVPAGQHLEGAMEFAHVLRDSAPLVMSMLKRFVRDTVLPKGPSELAGRARRDLLRVDRSEDRREGGAAFREKRKPLFKGR